LINYWRAATGLFCKDLGQVLAIRGEVLSYMDAAQAKSYQDIKAKLHVRESAAKRIKRSSLLGMISNVAGYLLFSCGPGRICT
jgi:hypothetical protein